MTRSSHSEAPLFTRGECFVDHQNRQVILHGINLVNKNKSEGYIGDEGPDTFASFRRWGLNCLRLGVIWDGLEPEPGVFDKNYLRKLQQQITWAHENDLYVFLDMHQDLYSVQYSDGAPEWATLTDGMAHQTYPGIWSDAYFTSPAVQAALDNFWANTPAPDGVGLQDHYARAWQVLAEYFAGQPNLIGYDLMNEPFPGRQAPLSLQRLLQSGMVLLAEQKVVNLPGSEEELLMRWSDPLERVALLEHLQDPSIYVRLVDAMQEIYGEFETKCLMPMYQRVAQAIRAVDPPGILFLETSMGSNMGVYSQIQPLDIAGKRDPQQAYAPHGYDLVVDTPLVAQASAERVGVIFNRHGETARKWGSPMLVGEWGAYGFTKGTFPAAHQVVRLFENLLCSETYWAYQKNLETVAYFHAIHRPYPERVAGRLKKYGYDPDQKLFECAWQEDPSQVSPSIIYLPNWLANLSIRLDPSGNGFEENSSNTDPGGVWVTIPPSGKAIQRRLQVGQLNL